MNPRAAVAKGDLLKQWRTEAGLTQYRAGRLLWPNSRHPDRQWNEAERRGDISEEDFASAAVRFGSAVPPVFVELAAVVQLVPLLALGWTVQEAAARCTAHLTPDMAFAVREAHKADIEELRQTKGEGDKARIMARVQVEAAKKAKHGLVAYRKVL